MTNFLAASPKGRLLASIHPNSWKSANAGLAELCKTEQLGDCVHGTLAPDPKSIW